MKTLSIIPDQRLRPHVENEYVRRASVLLIKTSRRVPGQSGQSSITGNGRPPDREEQLQIEALAREAGLSGDFVVVIDRVVFFDMNVLERTEFHLFRRKDVPYLMSLKVAAEVMET